MIVHPEIKNWIKYARFEDKHGYIAHARKVYERAVEFFGEEHIDENLFVAFAKFEEKQKEVMSRLNLAKSVLASNTNLCVNSCFFFSSCLTFAYNET